MRRMDASSDGSARTLDSVPRHCIQFFFFAVFASPRSRFVIEP